MSAPIAITLGTIGLAMVFFAWNIVPAPVVAVGASLALYFTGVLTPQETISGFGDPVVILIAALLAIGAGLEHAGVGAWAGQFLMRHAGQSDSVRLVAIMVAGAVFSALIGMNAGVAAMLPVTVVVAVRSRTAPSRLMIPLAFACLTGASLTLVGSPVNVITAAQAQDAGAGHIGFFEWALIGGPQLIGTIIITVLLGKYLLPERYSEAVPSDFGAAASPEAAGTQESPLTKSAPAAIGILGLLIVLLAFDLVPAPIAAVLCAALMVAARVLTLPQMWRGIDWNTCILIGAMIPPATAMSTTGAATLLGDHVVSALGSAGPDAVLAGVFTVAMVISQFISNTSTALVMMPVGLATALDLHVSPLPMMLAVAMGASASFLTPFANGVSLMVYGPGGYKFGDFWKLGLVVTLWKMAVTLVVVPLVWRF